MPITDATYTPRPPVFHAHQFHESDTADDLEAWAEGLFSPSYNPSWRLFRAAVPGPGVEYRNGTTWSPVLDGYWLVLDTVGNLSLVDPSTFDLAYAPAE